jgi:hypothetical protein
MKILKASFRLINKGFPSKFLSQHVSMFLDAIGDKNQNRQSAKEIWLFKAQSGEKQSVLAKEYGFGGKKTLSNVNI